jgi:two-component system chemotaxis response regulator CheY
MAKILLVDDSKLARKRLSDIFTSLGHTIVHECERGDKALSAYTTYKPDIVTMDINMPGMNGIEATKAIRDYDNKAKIVIISSANQEMNIIEGIHNGASYFLAKPFNDDHVLQCVKRLLAGSGKENEKKEGPALKDLNFDPEMRGLILIIDDSKMALKVTSDALSKDGHNVLTASSGKAGLELAKNGNPDLVILDVVMPDIDGYEVLKKLKGDDLTRHIPVIMYSSQTRKDDILTAMKFGVLDYISKNCDPLILSGKVRSALNQSREQRIKLEKNSSTNIIVSKKNGRTSLIFRFSLKSESAMAERNKILSGAFIKSISNDTVILDFRQINEMDSRETAHLKYIFSEFPEQELFVVCGKHYASFVTEFDTEGKNKFFISMGDLELYLDKNEVVNPIVE